MSRLEENNLKKKLMHNGFWLYLFAFLIAPAGYLLKVAIARELSVADIGLFYSIIGLIIIVSTYNDLGLTESLQYFLPKYLLKRQTAQAASLVRFTRVMQFVSGVLIGGGLYIAAPWLATHYFSTLDAIPLLRIFSLYFLIVNFYQVLNSLFTATQQVKRGQTVEFMKLWSTVLFTVGSMWLFDKLDVILYARYWLGGVAVAILVAFIGSKKLFPRIFQYSIPTLMRHLTGKTRMKYGWRVMLGQSAGTLYGQVNQQLTLLLLGASAAGIWAYYMSFFTIIGVVTQPLISYLFPLFNELYEKADYDKIRELYRYLIRGILLFGIVGGILGYYFSPWVSVFLYGEAFREAGNLFQIFAPWMRTTPVIGIAFADVASRGRVKQRVFVLLFGLLISLIATYLLIKQFGLPGGVYGQILGIFGLLFGVGWLYKTQLFTLLGLGRKH